MLNLDIDQSFNRAFFYSFSKKKFFVAFPVLFMCASFIIFCQTFSNSSFGWVKMSVIFLPILLTSGILLSLGVLLIRMYYHEVKNLKFYVKDLLKKSWELILGISYLSLLPTFAYICLWIVLGIFMLLQEIPGIGQFVGVVLSFAPFLLILSALILCFVNFVFLFFIAPIVALRAQNKSELAKSLWEYLKINFFSNLLMFFLAIIPLSFLLILSMTAAFLAHTSLNFEPEALSKGIYWFFIMIPFSAIMTPAVIFFFNFSAESYNALEKKLHEHRNHRSRI